MWPLRSLLGFQAGRRHLASEAASVSVERLAVYAWGAASQGVLGLNTTTDQYEPALVEVLPPDTIGVGAGHFHSFAVSSEGQLFSWGRNKEWQLGRPLEEGEFEFSPTPALVTNGGLERHAVASATGSGVASFVLTTEGLLFAFGTSKRGQLGLGAGYTTSREARRVRLPGRVAQLSAGWGHAAAVLDDGSLFSWGYPQGGRLGHSFAASVADEAEGSLAQRCVWEPRRVELLSGIKVHRVACGFDHTLVLTQDGALLSFGDNSLGQLGRPSRAKGEHSAPANALAWQVHAPSPDGQAPPSGAPRFRQVATSLGHSVAVMSDGSVTSWGWNSAGQLGLGEFVTAGTVTAPAPIYGLPRQRLAVPAAGRVHSLLLTDDINHDRASAPRAYGRSWPCLTMCHSWGSAANGRLGTGTYESAPYPELLPALDGEAVLDVACGLDHSLVLVAATTAACTSAGVWDN